MACFNKGLFCSSVDLQLASINRYYFLIAGLYTYYSPILFCDVIKRLCVQSDQQIFISPGDGPINYSSAHTDTPTHTHTHTCTHTLKHTYFRHMHTYTHTYKGSVVHTHTRTHTHTHTHTHTSAILSEVSTR